jgi:hypothetical protein
LAWSRSKTLKGEYHPGTAAPYLANFRQRALDVGILEIAKKTDLKIEIVWLERSKHRRVTSVTFRLKSKQWRTVTERAERPHATSK